MSPFGAHTAQEKHLTTLTRDLLLTYIWRMDDVFHALADPNRRKLLDALAAQDGQTTGQLETVLPEMTRFGVIKHLKVLEEASLIATRRSGRFKFHYLNRVPIQELADRWLSRFTRPWTEAIVDLKHALEGEPPMTQLKPQHVYVTYIRTTPEKLWQALTDKVLTQQYYALHSSVKSTWTTGDKISYETPDGHVFIEGEILECVPYKRLVHSFRGSWEPEIAQDAASQVSYEIEGLGELCKLTVLHDKFDGETATYRNVGGGWPMILSGLKTLLETGTAIHPMDIDSTAA